MSDIVNRQWRLVARPAGMVQASAFAFLCRLWLDTMVVDRMGLEPTTSALRTRRSPS